MSLSKEIKKELNKAQFFTYVPSKEFFNNDNSDELDQELAEKNKIMTESATKIILILILLLCSLFAVAQTAGTVLVAPNEYIHWRVGETEPYFEIEETGLLVWMNQDGYGSVVPESISRYMFDDDYQIEFLMSDGRYLYIYNNGTSTEVGNDPRYLGIVQDGSSAAIVVGERVEDCKYVGDCINSDYEDKIKLPGNMPAYDDYKWKLANWGAPSGGTTFDPSPINKEIASIKEQVSLLSERLDNMGDSDFDPSPIYEDIAEVNERIDNIDSFDPSPITERLDVVEEQIAGIEVGDDPQLVAQVAGLTNEVEQVESRVEVLETTGGGVDTVYVYMLGGDYLADTERVTGVNLISMRDFKAYPNPAVDYLNIEYDAGEMSLQGASLNVYDINGRTMDSIPLRRSSGNESINVASYPAGLYVYVILADNGKSDTKKFEVQ